MNERLEALLLEYLEKGTYDIVEKTCRILFQGSTVYLPLRHEHWEKGRIYTWDPIRSMDFLDGFLVIRGDFGSMDEHESYLLLTSPHFVRAPILRNCSFLEGPFYSIAGSLARYGQSRARSAILNGKMDMNFGTILEVLEERNQMLPLLDEDLRGPSFANFLYGEGTGLVSAEGLKSIPKATLQMLRFWVGGCSEIEKAYIFVGTHDRSEPDKILLTIAVRKIGQVEYMRDRFIHDLPQLRRKHPELLLVILVGTVNLEKFIPRDGESLASCFIDLS